MKKVIGIIIAVIVLLVVGTGIGYKVYKLTGKDFINSNSFFVSQINDIDYKKIEKFKEIAVNIDDSPELEVNFDKVIAEFKRSKHISFDTTVIMDFKTILNGGNDGLIIVDAGWKYPIAKYLFLHDDQTENLGDGYYRVEGIYIYPYRGVFLGSKKKSVIKDYLSNRSELQLNKELVKALEENKNSYFGTIAINGKDFFPIISTVTIGMDLDSDNNFQFRGASKFNKDKIEFKAGDKQLVKYISDDNIYFSLKDYSKTIDDIIKAYPMLYMYMGLSKMKTGVDLEDVLKEVDEEFIIGEHKGVVRLKKEHPLFNALIENGGLKTTMGNDNILFIGNIPKENNKLKLEKEVFLYCNLDKKALQELKYEVEKVEIKGINNEIHVDMTIKPEELYKNIRGLGGK